MTIDAPPAGTDAGVIPTGNSLVVLAPETWVGQHFPLESYLDVGGQVMQGQWVIVLYHADCETCRKVIPEYERLAQGDPAAPRVAFVEMPPYAATPADRLVSPSSAALQGRLSAQREWFAKTPIVLELSDGKVVAAESGAGVEVRRGVGK